MDMRTMFKENPLLAILRNVPADILIPYVESIKKGGVKIFEVALNTPDGLEQIRTLREYFGDEIMVGAGTAINVERAKAAIDAGAQFLLAPSTDAPVLAYCRDNGIAILPGGLTPTDVSVCVSYGFDVIKLFPAGDMPMSYVKSLKGPFDNTDYVAIGGVTPDNIDEFLKKGCIGVGLGSNMLPKEAVKSRDWEAGTEYVKALVAKVNAALA